MQDDDGFTQSPRVLGFPSFGGVPEGRGGSHPLEGAGWFSSLEMQGCFHPLSLFLIDNSNQNLVNDILEISKK
jgi:hypothetical protein